MIVVLDASAVVELVLGTRSGRQILHRVSDPKVSLRSPELVDLEVLNVLRRYEQRETVSHARADEAYRNLIDLDLKRHRHEPLLARIWSRRLNLTAYDAAYVTLAEILEAPLLTTDGRLSRVPGLPTQVDVFAVSSAAR